MKEIIRQILREELGVPKGLLDVSKTVFDDFKNYFLSAIDENQNEYNFVIVPTQEAKIGDMVIDEIVFDIQIHEDNPVDILASLLFHYFILPCYLSWVL